MANLPSAVLQDGDLSGTAPFPMRMQRKHKPVFECSLHRGDMRRPVQAAAPLKRYGVTDEQWLLWLKEIDDAVESHAFNRQPVLGLCYWCCPLLCIQPIVCMACPTTWWMSMDLEERKARAEDTINSALASHGLFFIWTPWHWGRFETNTLFSHRSALRRPLPTEVPPRLGQLGASQEQWARWSSLIQSEEKAHLLQNCPPTAAMAYTFFPLGALQPCICLLNPLTCYSYARVANARREVTKAINADLMQMDAHFRYTAMEAACFSRGPPAAKPATKGGLTQVIAVASSVGVPGAARMLQEAEEEEHSVSSTLGSPPHGPPMRAEELARI